MSARFLKKARRLVQFLKNYFVSKDIRILNSRSTFLTREPQLDTAYNFRESTADSRKALLLKRQ